MCRFVQINKTCKSNYGCSEWPTFNFSPQWIRVLARSQRRHFMGLAINQFEHALKCPRTDCSESCQRMKSLLQHVKNGSCREDSNIRVCLLCRKFLAFCIYHERYCNLPDNRKCIFPLCSVIKRKKRQFEKQKEQKFESEPNNQSEIKAENQEIDRAL